MAKGFNIKNYKCPQCRRILDSDNRGISGNAYKCPNCGELWEIVNQTWKETHSSYYGKEKVVE